MAHSSFGIKCLSEDLGTNEEKAMIYKDVENHVFTDILIRKKHDL